MQQMAQFAVSSQINTKHKNTVRADCTVVEILTGCTHSDHWVLKGLHYVINPVSLCSN